MADELNYEELLDRAYNAMPADQRQLDQRWSVPEVDLMYEGRITVWKNFGDIMEAVRREADHILGHILRSLGSAGTMEGRRVIIKSVISADKLKEKLEEYITTYVICGECGKPDTHLVKEARTQVIECMACGAKRPVKVKKGLQAREARVTLNPGDEMEVLIQDVGKMGDGLAKLDKFMIYVPGVAKGTKVKIRVERVNGNIVIGRTISK